jgi:hypothetical protein
VQAFDTGYSEEGCVPEFLARFPGGLEVRWILIPWLDSAPAQPESLTIARAFHSSAGTIEWTAGCLLAESNALEALVAEDSLFYGFDEVVIFDRRPVKITSPPAVCTTDTSLSEAAVDELCAYLAAHAATAAAGDGVGLRWFLQSDLRR